MDIKVANPTSVDFLIPGQVILTGESVFMVISVKVNDFTVGLVNLSTGETILKESIVGVTDIMGIPITKVYDNKQIQLILP